jgi:hypothetical protein
MAQSVQTLNSKSSADEIKNFLKERFKDLPQNELKKMKELQEVVKKYPSKGNSLVDELIEDRRKDGL